MRGLVPVIVLCLSVVVHADFLEVRRAATLKASPDSKAETVAKPEVGSQLKLLREDQTNGYYFATTKDGASGWVYRTLVRRSAGDPEGFAAAPAAPAAAPVSSLHSVLCLISCPAGAPTTNDIVTREIYILSNNGTTKFADWVAYEVTPQTIGPTKPRQWKTDPMRDTDRTLQPSDYDDANAALQVDRGHQAPLASLTGTTHWPEANFLSNITPQKTALNQGPWERLENAERTLAKKPDSNGVFSITRPLYERSMPSLPHTTKSHRVPSGYWKIVSVQRNGVLEVAAFIFDQDTLRSEEFCRHQTTVDEVERRSHLNFFSGLDADTERDLESSPGDLGGEMGCSS